MQINGGDGTRRDDNQHQAWQLVGAWEMLGAHFLQLKQELLIKHLEFLTEICRPFWPQLVLVLALRGTTRGRQWQPNQPGRHQSGPGRALLRDTLTWQELCRCGAVGLLDFCLSVENVFWLQNIWFG